MRLSRAMALPLAALAWGIATSAAVGQSGSPPRQIAPDVVAPPQLDPDDLKRDEPRAPLSELGPAGPPKPRKPKGNPNLFTPLATAAGVVEARGLTVTVAGIEVIGADETCTYQGADWACGVRARSAFRSFLGSRALRCDLPPDKVDGPATAHCSIGKQDVGTWLVSNGWARPAAGGPYVDAGDKARNEAKGVFGPPPNLDGLEPGPAPFSASSTDQPILEAPAPEPAPVGEPPIPVQ